jgi:Secretion system C-terminal sorting domain
MKKTATLSALFLLPSLAFCCSCLRGTSFCELITDVSIVAKVRIFDTHLDSLNMRFWVDVVVEEKLKGNMEQDTITILASQGTTCDHEFSEFQIDGNLIIQYTETLTGGPTDWPYFIFGSICEESYLHFKDDMVIGFIREEYEMQPYQTFRNQLSDCANYTHIFNKEELEQFIHIFPVPAASEAFIDTQIPFDYTMTIFTATGQLLQQETVIGKYRHPLYISDLPNGFYFVRLQIGDVPILKKLVIQR